MNKSPGNFPLADPVAKRIQSVTAYVARRSPRRRYGELINIQGAVVRVALEGVRIGDICSIQNAGRKAELLAQVIGVERSTAILTPFGKCHGLSAGALVFPRKGPLVVPVGPALFGRVLNGFGQLIDGGPALPADTPVRAAKGPAPTPMARPLIDRPLITGLRAVDGLTTLGRGQRMGVFGPPGTGKSTFLAAIAEHCEADVIVIGLVGERGREVREFLERTLPKGKRGRVIVVAATSDSAAMERVYGAHVATAIAESFQDQGKSVLLLMDSLTRVARALREIGLAAGEAPTRRGYPASVYPALPELIERTGRTIRGDITAIYTVLTEGDGQGDPIAEEVRSLTDGHIVLSPKIAESGRYPAIDILQSLSRVMVEVTSKEHRHKAAELRGLLARYDEIEILLQVGEYKPGHEPEADLAVRNIDKIRAFLTQETHAPSKINETLSAMAGCVA